MNEDLELRFKEEEKIEKLLTVLNGGKPIKQRGEKTKNMIVREIDTGILYDVEYVENIKCYFAKGAYGRCIKYFESEFESVFVSPWTRQYVIEREAEE